MILSFIIQGLTTALHWFFNLLPSWTMPSWLSSGVAFPSGVASAIGGLLAGVSPYFPVNLLLTILSSVLSLWGAVVGYLLFQWVWSHVPTIAGFGTGDGS